MRPLDSHFSSSIVVRCSQTFPESCEVVLEHVMTRCAIAVRCGTKALKASQVYRKKFGRRVASLHMGWMVPCLHDNILLI